MSASLLPSLWDPLLSRKDPAVHAKVYKHSRYRSGLAEEHAMGQAKAEDLEKGTAAVGMQSLEMQSGRARGKG
jgi:hypothetical protein